MRSALIFDSDGVTAMHVPMVGGGTGCELTGPGSHAFIRIPWSVAHALATSILYFDTFGKAQASAGESVEVPQREVAPEVPPRALSFDLSFQAAAGELELTAFRVTGRCLVCGRSLATLAGEPMGRSLRHVKTKREVGRLCHTHTLDVRALLP